MGDTAIFAGVTCPHAKTLLYRDNMKREPDTTLLTARPEYMLKILT